MNLDEEFEGRINNATSLDDLAEVLQNLLSGNYNVWKDGRLMGIKVLIDKVGGLRIEIRHNEHSPPHFHIVGDGLDVSYAIMDGSLLRGNPNPIHDQLMRYWYKLSRLKLIEIWNKTRPSNCPVGPINIQ